MIDFTTIQTFPTSPTIQFLQNKNKLITHRNQLLWYTLIGLLVISVIYSAHLNFKAENELDPIIDEKH